MPDSPVFAEGKATQPPTKGSLIKRYIPLLTGYGVFHIGDEEFFSLCEQQGKTTAEQDLWKGIAADFVEDNKQRLMESTKEWADPKLRPVIEQVFADLVRDWREAFLFWRWWNSRTETERNSNSA